MTVSGTSAKKCPSCWLWDYLRRSKQGMTVRSLVWFVLIFKQPVSSFRKCTDEYSRIWNTCWTISYRLSGGIDSCATAVIVHSMCRLVYKDITEGDTPQVLKDLLLIAGEPSDSTWRPSSAQDVASRIFHTAYLGMETNSSPDTRSRAKNRKYLGTKCRAHEWHCIFSG